MVRINNNNIIIIITIIITTTTTAGQPLSPSSSAVPMFMATKSAVARPPSRDADDGRRYQRQMAGRGGLILARSGNRAKINQIAQE
jgi:hypothetical protein